MTHILKRTITEWLDDDCPRRAAALWYDAVLALPPLLVLLLLLLGISVDPAELRGPIHGDFRSVMGPDAADQVRAILENVGRPGVGGPLVAGMGINGVLSGATGRVGTTADHPQPCVEGRADAGVVRMPPE